MKPRSIFTELSPAPVGPYCQAVEVGNLLFISGQIPLHPLSGEIVGTTVKEQTHQALSNLKSILQSQNLRTDALVKTTVFLQDIAAFAEFNAVYEEELEGARPARSVIEVSRLPKNVLVEIEAVACR